MSPAVDHTAVRRVFLNLVCSILGTGVLGLPRAVASVGWWGLLLLVATAAVQTWTGYLLLSALTFATARKGKEGRGLTYGGLARATGGPVTHVVVEICTLSSNLGTAVLFLILD
jgi:amino acid permease